MFTRNEIQPDNKAASNMRQYQPRPTPRQSLPCQTKPICAEGQRVTWSGYPRPGDLSPTPPQLSLVWFGEREGVLDQVTPSPPLPPARSGPVLGEGGVTCYRYPQPNGQDRYVWKQFTFPRTAYVVGKNGLNVLQWCCSRMMSIDTWKPKGAAEY